MNESWCWVIDKEAAAQWKVWQLTPARYLPVLDCPAYEYTCINDFLNAKKFEQGQVRKVTIYLYLIHLAFT